MEIKEIDKEQTTVYHGMEAINATIMSDDYQRVMVVVLNDDAHEGSRVVVRKDDHTIITPKSLWVPIETDETMILM